MADLRELVILSPDVLFKKKETPPQKRLASVRMVLRRAFITCSRVYWIRRAQVAIYHAHFWLAAALAKQFKGTRAVYGGGGVTAGDLYVGISDIDIAIFGDWPEKRQFTLLKLFGVLTVLSPLYDRGCMVNICTVRDLQAMSATNYTLALMYARGRTQWKLLFGEDVLANLPVLDSERFSGCVVMEPRKWWGLLASASFGGGVMGRDPIFQNSACFKVAAEMLRAERMLDNGLDLSSRKELLNREIANTDSLGTDPDLLRRLVHSAEGGFLNSSQDFRHDTLQWLTPRMQRFSAAAHPEPCFHKVMPLTVDSPAHERLIAPPTLDHCHRVLQTAQKAWGGLRSAHLVPALTMMSLDSLALILQPENSEAGNSALPSLGELRAVCEEHLRTRDLLPQRLRLFILLSGEAFLLDVGAAFDLYHLTFTPQCTPDVFAALSMEGHALLGEAPAAGEPLYWTSFAHENAMEELHARRAAFQRFGVVSRPRLLENLRNFWRYLQLCELEQIVSTRQGAMPLTIASTARAVSARHPEMRDELRWLEAAFRASLLGEHVEETHAVAQLKSIYGCMQATEARS